MTKKRSSFKNKVSADTRRQKREASSYGHLYLPKGVSVYSPEPGSRAKLDFMPYEVSDERHPDRDVENEIAVPGSLWYKRPYKLHRNIGVENDSYVCPTSIGKPCPICEYRSKRMKEGAEREETDSLKASKRDLYAVIPIGSKDHEEEVHIFDIIWWLFKNLLNQELEEDEDNAVFPDLEGGKSVKIRFESRTIGKGQPFAEAGRIDFVDREEDYDDSILEDVPDLDKVLKIVSYDELQQIFFEIDEDDEKEGAEKEEVEKEEPALTRTRKIARKPKEEKEEKEEEPAPTRTRTRTRKPKEEIVEGGDRCPYGHTFGKDTDKFPDDCDECDIWDDCIDEKEK